MLTRIRSLWNSPIESRVARRVFGLFLLCSFVPLLALSIIVFAQVRSELRRQAESRLHGQSKSAGMAIADRLHVLQDQLNTLVTDIENGGELPLLTERDPDQGPGLFQSFSLCDSSGQALRRSGKAGALPSLGESDRAHLQSGRMSLLTRANERSLADVYLVQSLPSSRLLFACIDRDFLWGGAGFVIAPVELLALDASGQVLFSTTETIPTDRLAAAGYGLSPFGEFEWESLEQELFGAYWTLFLGHELNTQWTLVHSEPRAAVLDPLANFRTVFVLVMVLTFLIVVSLSMNQIRRQLIPLQQLRSATTALSRGDLGSRVRIETKDEFAHLGASFNEMAGNLQRSFNVITDSNAIGISLTRQRDVQRLLEMVAAGSQRIVDTDGAAIYLTDGRGRLSPTVLRVASLDIDEVAEAGLVEYQPEVATPALLETRDSLRGRGTDVGPLGAPLFRQLQQRHRYQLEETLSIPLRDHDDEFIGVLQLFNPRSENAGFRFSQDAVAAAESLASQAAVVLTTSRLLDSYKGMFEGLTELIATAIDEKSPYTHEHCQRVPILAMMIAEAACQVSDGPFADFHLTEDELYELKVAALLHDCGKVTTPVHIVDKATKLETIYDRIDLVATRFEITRRDREIERLRNLLTAAGISAESTIDEAWGRQLEEDLAFLRQSNLGSEYMEATERDRVQEISGRYRAAIGGSAPEPILTEDEVYNLTIPKGTLTPEEREIINDHVVTTIVMLEKLPYPKKLRNVPFLAGTHHEKIDGSGYPLGLKGDDLPIRAQIIGLADIFEALTAKDRPYKPARSVAEALAILGKMKDQGQIEPKLFELFVDQKIHVAYAREFLDPGQIESVDPGEDPAGRRAAAA